jgi:hypothetical protein
MSEIEYGEVNVHVKSMPPVTLDEPYFYRSTFRTVVLTAAQNWAELIGGPDPTRCETIVTAVDGAIVLCSSSAEAAQLDNNTTGLPSPRGAIIPQNVPVRIPDAMSDMWVAAPLTGINTSRVSVIIVRRTRKS